eukprot:3776258-Lingulodinium_polyedra.AAC.1
MARATRAHASRRGGKWWIQPHLCVALGKRSNPVLAATTAGKSHAPRTPCEHQFWAFAWCVRRVRFASRCGGEYWIRPHLRATFENAAQKCARIQRSPPR